MIKHYPVMYRNVITKIKNLNLSRTLKIADCNFGFGGHSHLILNTFPNCVMYIILHSDKVSIWTLKL